MLFLIIFVLFCLYLYVYCRKAYSKFSNHGVNHFKPVPLLGNLASTAMQKIHIGIANQYLYNAFPNDRFVGNYELTRPVIMLRDLELIKKITLKDFEHFVDHRKMVDGAVDKLFGRSLINLKGPEWKDMRSTLSPAFTSSKMKSMIPFMVETNEQLMKYVKNMIQESKEDYIDIDFKDLTTRYANDVIASCAFGVKVDSHNEGDNEFYTMGKSTAHFGFRRILVFLGYSAFPDLMTKFNVKLFENEIRLYFKNLVMSNMKDREDRNLTRPDMIHLLMEAKKGKLTYDEKSQDDDAGFATVQESEIGKKTVNRTWCDDDLVAQAFLFFMAGFETVSSTMSFLMYELAVHPEVQERLVKEIKENEAKNKNLEYNTIHNLKYLDMVVSEVLRLWPPVVGIDRMCTKPYNMGKPHDKATKDYILKEGDLVSIPMWAIHRNPDYFPDPDKFDPERFSDENKINIKPFTYFPFGVGPRNCIGSRFGLCEVKIMVYQFLLNFEVSPCEKTIIPVELAPESFTLVMKGGYWLRVRQRKN